MKVNLMLKCGLLCAADPMVDGYAKHLQLSEQPLPLRHDLCAQFERAVQARHKGCHLAGSVYLECGANAVQFDHVCTAGWCMLLALVAWWSMTLPYRCLYLATCQQLRVYIPEC